MIVSCTEADAVEPSALVTVQVIVTVFDDLSLPRVVIFIEPLSSIVT